MVLDRLSLALRAEMRPGKGRYFTAETTYLGKRVCLIKPLTYVNESGMAVSDAVGMFEVSLENLLVVCDDCELPFGKIRLRRKGQHGGHRGLESIIYHLKTEEFPRLRLGIEKPPDVDLAEYVLGEFEPAEKEKLPVVLEEAGRAAMLFLEYGVEKAMSLVNRKAENG